MATVSYAAKLGALIIVLEIVIKVGKYLPAIVVSFVCLNLLLVAYYFAGGNLAFAILNSIFALAGIIFLGQLHRKRNIHASGYHNQDRRQKRSLAIARKERKDPW